MSKFKIPKWHREMDCFKSFKTTFLVEGNIYDLHPYPEEEDGEIKWHMLKLDQYLFEYLTSNGYETVIFYNHIDGFYNEFSEANLNNFRRLAKDKSIKQVQENENEALQEEQESKRKFKTWKVTLEKATEVIRNALGNNQNSNVVIMNLASRYASVPNNLNDEELRYYSRLFLTTLNPTQVRTESGHILNNLLFIITSKTNDVPAWLYIDNPYVKTINVTKPDKDIRRQFIDSQIRYFTGSKEFNDKELKQYKEKFVGLTDGFKNIELNGLRILCDQNKIPINKIEDAITLFKYGFKENPWNKIDDETLNNAEEFIKKRVKGQEPCIIQTLDIIKRAVTGMSGLQHSSSSKPRGILFFAGPTGTGKTELAKTLASLLFGDESACIRFDMSEYQQPHSDQKLLGAPPGYVGYEAGGQLTNAVKERPFSVLLFDEIEKAHASIFDKFLQILEDGRMTDGQGQTVYFSDCIIIFTSNLGIYVYDEKGNRVPNITIEMEDYDAIRDNVLNAIKDYFTLELGRPEILNRIGENFVVFDYIRKDVAEQIAESQLEKIIASLKDNKDIQVNISEKAKTFIYDKATAKETRENGGRGVGNAIEKYFINPLSRYIFDNRKKIEEAHKEAEICELTVNEIAERNGVVEMQCEVRKIE